MRLLKPKRRFCTSSVLFSTYLWISLGSGYIRKKKVIDIPLKSNVKVLDYD